eukprot:scaffold266847_cov21-Tisochrysis_lutea.AAC.1
MANSRASAMAQPGSEEQEQEKLVDALLGMGRDAAPLPPESGLGPSSFSEHDINVGLSLSCEHCFNSVGPFDYEKAMLRWAAAACTARPCALKHSFSKHEKLSGCTCCLMTWFFWVAGLGALCWVHPPGRRGRPEAQQ